MNCLFCNSQNIGTAAFPRPTSFNGKTFSYKLCKECHLIFIDPIPAADDYDTMYSKSYHDQFYFKKEQPDFNTLFTLIDANINEHDILDYGCGDAAFLNFFSAKGYKCTGVEYDPELIQLLQQKNPKISFTTTDQFWEKNSDEKYSAIFLGDVLEHMSSPDSFLKDLVGKLKKDGILIAQGPLENNSSMALYFRKLVSKLKPTRIASHVPYHIFFSNYKNQKQIFEQNELKTLEYKIFEMSWPFPSQMNKSVSNNFKYLLGKISISISGISGSMGNRFIYLGRKK